MFVCYRFESEEQFLTLATAEGLVQDDRLITGGHGWAIDPVGNLDEGDAVYDPETGEVITPATPIPGYHVNTLGIAPESFDEFLVVVSTPAQVFLGGPTQAPSTDVLEQITQ